MQNKFKRLAIISDCIHYYDTQGKVVTENHIFRKQMMALAKYFEHTTIYCAFEKFSADKIVTAYNDAAIDFFALPNAGGNTFRDKLGIIKVFPKWLAAFKHAHANADIIYQRFPNNLNIPGFFYFRLRGAKTFATFTGTWANYKGEPLTYRFQKWLLKKFFKGPVAAYIFKEQETEKIFKTISPSYSSADWLAEEMQVQQRIKNLQEQFPATPVFVSVGGLVPKKNQQYILDAFLLLHQQNYHFKLYIVGDGYLKDAYQKFIDEHNLGDKIFLTGKKTDIELKQLYRESNFLVQATLAEGFGKVPIEGFFHGVIPLLNNVTLAGEMTGNGERGFLFSANDVNNLVLLVKNIFAYNTVRLNEIILNGREYAKTQTLENWSAEIIEQIKKYFA